MEKRERERERDGAASCCARFNDRAGQFVAEMVSYLLFASSRSLIDFPEIRLHGDDDRGIDAF